MALKLENIDTSLFVIDPKKADFVERMQKIEQFNFRVEKLSTKKILTFIVLCYDLKSELLHMYKSYHHRKREAAIIAGWELDANGRLPKLVEYILLGNHASFNKAVVHYCFMSKNPYFIRLATLEFNYSKKAAESYEKYDKALHELLANMEKDIVLLREKIFGGDEVEKMRQALYDELEETKNLLTLEDRVERIEKGTLEKEFNPYEKDYSVERLTFEGDELPES